MILLYFPSALYILSKRQVRGVRGGIEHSLRGAAQRVSRWSCHLSRIGLWPAGVAWVMQVNSYEHGVDVGPVMGIVSSQVDTFSSLRRW